MRLIFGVLDVAYSGANSQSATAGAKTTGDVAEILEAKYHVMQTFYDLRRDKIAQFLTDSMAASLELRMKTGRTIDERATLTYGGDQKIEAEFRAFLTANEMATLLQQASGAVLSAAAARGVNHRFKHPYAARPARPAFVDTGLFRISFRAWTQR